MKIAEILADFLWNAPVCMTVVFGMAGNVKGQEVYYKATVTVHTDIPAKIYSPMIFGGFLEHFDSQIYGGVFEPGSPLTDNQGFRLDVIDALKELKVPVIRWPGGCFVDALATMDEKGENWAISLVNRHPSEVVACKIIMGNNLLNGKYKATVLTGDSADSYNDIEHPNRVAPKKRELRFNRGVTTLPSHSLIIVHVPVKS